MGPEGHVPKMLVFGTLPTLPILNKNIPGNEDRLKALRTARDEIANIRAEQAIRRAIKNNNLSAAHYELKSGDKVYAYSESRDKWILGLKLVEVEDKNAWINDGHRIYKLSILQIMPEPKHGVRDAVYALIKSPLQLKTNLIPSVFITEVLTPADIRK